MPRTGAEPSLDALRAWLTAKVAEYAECAPGQIRPDVSLAEYGLDSMYGLMLCGDIEDHLGLTVDPTVAWDYSTIDALTGFLDAELERAGEESG
jgi:acyl carrier protein